MAFYRTYIQQLSYDGVTYTKGNVVDIYDTYHMAVEKFPFQVLPEAKPLPVVDFPDEDGVEGYYGSRRYMKDYDMEVVILYCGTHATMRDDINNFLRFLYGKNLNATGFLLAIYDEHVKLGRKDVRLEKVDPDLYLDDDSDTETIARFKLVFHVDDPATNVQPTYSSGVATQLTWTEGS